MNLQGLWSCESRQFVVTCAAFVLGFSFAIVLISLYSNENETTFLSSLLPRPEIQESKNCPPLGKQSNDCSKCPSLSLGPACTACRNCPECPSPPLLASKTPCQACPSSPPAPACPSSSPAPACPSSTQASACPSSRPAPSCPECRPAHCRSQGPAPTQPRCFTKKEAKDCPIQDPQEWKFNPELNKPRNLECPPDYRPHMIFGEKMKDNPFVPQEMENCTTVPPDDYIYPPNWPKREVAPVHFPNFGPLAPDVMDCKPFDKNFKEEPYWCNYFKPHLEESKMYFEDELLPYLPLCSGRIRTTIEIGGGTGELAHFLADYDILTVTINGKTEQRGRYIPFQEFISERGMLHVTLDAKKPPYPFASHSFDLLYNKNFMRFVSPASWRKMFNEWNRIVRPGGYVIFRTGEGELDPDIFQLVTSEFWWELIDYKKATIYITSTKSKPENYTN